MQSCEHADLIGLVPLERVSRQAHDLGYRAIDLRLTLRRLFHPFGNLTLTGHAIPN